MDRFLAQLKHPQKEKKKSDSSGTSCESTSNTDTSDSDSDCMYYCRICNKSIKGSKELKPENEVCKNCVSNFPERMFCKSCKRYFPNKKPFSKCGTRCNFCVDKLNKLREQRKLKREAENSEDKGKKKSKKEDDDGESYVCLYIKGQRIFKKQFEA